MVVLSVTDEELGSLLVVVGSGEEKLVVGRAVVVVGSGERVVTSFGVVVCSAVAGLGLDGRVVVSRFAPVVDIQLYL
jgi:hypothetical protein